MFVIAGATGHTGTIITDTLLDHGKRVRALVHQVAKGERLRVRGAEVVAASLEDADALAAALVGAEAAYFLLPPRPTSATVLADNARVTDNIARAVEQNHVPHVVLLSSVAAHRTEGTGPIKSLHDAEKRLERTGAAVTPIRAAYFMENWAGSLPAVPAGTLPSFLRADLSLAMVAIQDIGRVAATALLEGGGKEGLQPIELAGPKEYTPLEVAAAVSTIVGKPITLQVGPEDAIVPAFQSYGMSENMAALYREMILTANKGELVHEGPPNRFVRGATPIEDVLRPLLGR